MYKKYEQKSRLFLYPRKSSESEDRQVQSIEDQINRLTDLAKALHIEIIEVLPESKSAKKPGNRPVFEDMLRRIEKGEADGILCWSINRLSRNPIDSGRISWMLQQGIIKCIQTIDRKYLPDDNVLLFNVESGMANQYIIDLRKVCRRGMEGKANRGWMPGCATLGYMNDKAEHTIVPDQERFPLVRQMWEMMLSGNYTPPQIRKIANKEWGFRTPKRKQMGGKELSNAVMYKMFGNIFYTGMFQWSGKLYPGNHTPMITLDEYDRVQILLGRKGNPRPQHHEFAYTGLIKCGECQSMYTATEKKKFVKTTGQYKTYGYYHCTRKRKTGMRCGNMPVTVFDLETQFEMELERYTIVPEFLKWILKILAKEKDTTTEDTTRIRSMREKSLSETQKELDALTRMRYRDLIDDETFVKEKNVLADQITKLKVQLKEDTNYDEKWVELTERAFYFATYARQNLIHGTAESKREIFTTFGSNYQLKDKRLIFEASVWLIPIAKAYPALYAELKRLELKNSLDIEGRKAALASIFQLLSATVEDVRTALKRLNNPDLYIPKLKRSIPENYITAPP
jgi:site-specific DNA recombinase